MATMQEMFVTKFKKMKEKNKVQVQRAIQDTLKTTSE